MRIPFVISQVDKLNTEVATLEQQISCMEDELSEARVECSRLKTELVSERSAWEVKVSEMMSRINEVIFFFVLRLCCSLLRSIKFRKIYT